LAVSGKSDTELLTLILWFGEGVMGPESLQSSFTLLAPDPSASLDSSGILGTRHPWSSILKEIQRWSDSGRFVDHWWDYSELDVVAAVASGKVRWGLGWSGAHFTSLENGIPTSSLQLVPAWPGQRSTSLLGRWLFQESSEGWGDPVRVGESKARLSSVIVGQQWLKQGLIMADSNLPAVNQETKALSLGLLSAGALISAPTANTDLSRWHPLLEALRTELRR
jgi:hypothetical protein